MCAVPLLYSSAEALKIKASLAAADPYGGTR